MWLTLDEARCKAGRHLRCNLRMSFGLSIFTIAGPSSTFASIAGDSLQLGPVCSTERVRSRLASETWKKMASATPVFEKMAKSPRDISQADRDIIEQFVVALYCKAFDGIKVNEALKISLQRMRH